MKQRINLLPPRPKIERDYLLFGSVLWAFIGVLLGCSVLTAWLWYDVNHKEERLQALLTSGQQQQQQLNKLETLQVQRKPDPALEYYRDQLKQTVLSKQQLSGLLQTLQPKYQQGFSGGLLAFANSTPDKIWLTAFKMTSGSLILDLTGESVDTSQIPLFLGRLAQQEFFQNMHFAELKTEKKNDKAYIFNAHGVITGSTHD